MIQAFSNYHILNQIDESPNSVVYRAIRESDNLPVILKVMRSEYPSPAELACYQQEYELTRTLNVEGVVKTYGLEKHQNTLAIVLEDFGGESLKSLTKTRPFSLSEFLSIALKAVISLGQIQAENLIHKDINPSNLVYAPETGQLKIIDLGISTRLTRENPTLKNLNILEGTLAYMSPEQTGRMNRSLDYRTDFYSLGVTFYELLTNQLPFTTTDDLELIHCHLAKIPASPAEINPAIPHPLSAVVMKLMAKNAEDRYQSAMGLKYDLEQILISLIKLTDLSGFELGQQDYSDRFQLPQKLYGRESEIETLLDTFAQVSQGPSELLLIAGYSGIGKTSLVQELCKPITTQRGYFIAGKFDQLQRNVPYSALLQAFRHLIQQLLAETDAVLQHWQQRLATAVGPNGQVLVDVLPEIELLLGPQPAVPILAPTESQNRFNLVFQNFIRACCQPEHPLVIFLDDLQWVDSASLKLMTLMMNDIPYLFLIGAYRDNEVTFTHPLMTTVAELQNAGVMVKTLTLTPLKLPHIQQLLADTLSVKELVGLAELAKLLLDKTAGNPFFLGEFIKTLYTENLLQFDVSQRRWQWELAEIKAHNITDNVVELMTGKIQRLAINAQQVLTLAAAIGNQFDLATLSIVSQQTSDWVKSQLWEVLVEGLVVPVGEYYKFVHDRIQQAAYSLISEEKKPALHWQIGQLLKTSLGETLGERLFEVVDHLNQGSSQSITLEEKLELVHLNVQVGQKAKLAAAYQAALKYLQIALHLLPEHSWETDYELTLTVYNETVGTAYASCEFELVEQLVSVILKQAHTILDRVKAYEIKIQTCMVKNQLSEALKVSLTALTLLDEIFPEDPTTEEIQQALAEVATQLAQRSIDSLSELPPMTNSYKLATIDILSRSITPAQFTKPKLVPILVAKIVSLSIQYGNTSASADGYSIYGMVLCGTLEKFEMGFRFGQLALKVLDQFNAKTRKAKVLTYMYNFINNCTHHARESLSPLLEAHQNGLETGELEFSAYSILVRSYYFYLVGHDLIGTEHEMTSASKILSQTKQTTTLNYHQIFWQTVLNLRGNSEFPGRLVGPVYYEELMLPIHQQANDKPALAFLFFNKMVLDYLFGDDIQAVKHGNLASIQPYFEGASQSSIVAPAMYFYHSLAYLARFADLPVVDREKTLQVVMDNQQRLKKRADSAPMNFQHKYDLVEAETARVLGQFETAAKYYEKAIAGARENDYLQEEALAYELAAKFYLSQGMSDFAQTYLTKAYQRYQRWGAVAKLKHLEKHYPQLLIPTVTTSQLKGTIFATHLSTGRDSEFDLYAVMRANQAIFGEIFLDKLLTALMKVILQNAGAQIGYFILPHQEQLMIEASGTIDAESEITLDESFRPANFGGNNDNVKCELVTGLHALPLEDCQSISQTIVNYVARTKQSVVLEDATRSEQFINDAYLKQQKTKSILCVPLINQGKLVSIVYLENNVTTGAFTPKRIEVLNLISSQMAISIENAILYKNLSQKNKMLGESEYRFRTLFNSANDAILLIEKGKFVDCNPKALEIFRCRREWIIDHSPEVLSPPIQSDGQSSTDKAFHLINATLAGYPQFFEWLHKRGDGTLFEAEISLNKVEINEVVYLQVIIRDVSERKQAEANKIRLIQEQEAKQAAIRYSQEIEAKNIELAYTLQQLRDTQHQLVESEKMAALGNLVAGVAHEINTPVGIGVTAATQLDKITIDFAALYKSGKMSRPDLEHYLNATHQTSTLILKNLTRAAELTQTFKQVAVDQTSEQQQTIILPDYLYEVFMSLKQKLKHTGYQLSIHCDKPIQMTIYPAALSQIITNLIMNSLQHGFEGRSEGRIVVTVTSEGQRVMVDYRDDGKGIAPEVISKIFEPFFTTNRQEGGVGLGLHIVYNLVTHKLNGTIHCDSELGKGVVFIITLPLV